MVPLLWGVERKAGLAYTPWPRGSPDRLAGEAKGRARSAPPDQGRLTDPRAKGGPGGREGIRDADSLEAGFRIQEWS